MDLWGHRESFTQDEYQHAHIAWNILQGKLIYRDFFEHHGALSGYLNAFILFLRGENAPSFDSFYTLRKVMSLLLIVQGYLVYLIIKHFSVSRTIALSGIILFFANHLMMIFGYATRPDGLQNLFLLSGIYFIVKNKLWKAGISLGLAWAAHPKAIIFITFILSSFLISEIKSRNFELKHYKKYLPLFWGIVLVGLALFLFFAIQGAGSDFLRSTFFYNFKTVNEFKSSRGVGFLISQFWMNSRSLLVLFVISFFLMVAHCKKTSTPELQIIWRVSLFCVLMLLLPLAGQVLVVALAMMSILSCIIFYMTFGSRLSNFIFLPLSLYLVWSHYSALPANRSRYNKMQESELGFIIDKVGRDEKVAYAWPGNCAAYVFNSDSDKDWMLGINNRQMVDSSLAENMERVYRVKILTGEIRYLVFHPHLLQFLTQEMRDYVKNNFSQRGCIWIRK